MKRHGLVACAAVLAIAVAGCTKSDDTSTDGSFASPTGTSAAASATAAGAMSAASSSAMSGAASPASDGAPTDSKTNLPLYPNATSQASGASNGQAGTVLTTEDAFDKVYAWYKSKMPAGSEKAKLSAGGIDTVTFQVDQSSGKGTVAITSQGGKTTITLAQTTP
jgi:hypothetical protein